MESERKPPLYMAEMLNLVKRLQSLNHENRVAVAREIQMKKTGDEQLFDFMDTLDEGNVFLLAEDIFQNIERELIKVKNEFLRIGRNRGCIAG